MPTATNLPNPLKVVVVREEPRETLDRMEAVAPGRILATNVSERDDGRPEREAAFREAHVAFVTAGCPRDLAARMPNLLWVHARFVGISELNNCDFWGTDIVMTSARGSSSTGLPMAEMALAGGLMIAKQLHKASRTVVTFWREGPEEYQPWLIAGKTIGIIGLGGSGSSLARLAKGVGMRVVVTRRSALQRARDVDGVDELFPPSELKQMAAQSNFLAVCAASTPETYQMVNGEVLDALPDGAIVMNITRGELIDEEALIQRLDSGKLSGAYLDCYAGEQDALGPTGKPRDPDRRLAAHPRVVMTPHVSIRSDGPPERFSVDIFCENLDRFLKGEPLLNRVEWERGY